MTRLTLVYIIVFCMLISIAHANSIDDYTDTLTSDGVSCWAESNGRIVNTTPCTAGSPTKESEYTVETTQGKLALAFNKEVEVKAKALRTRQVLWKIQSFSGYKNEKIVVDTPLSGSSVATTSTKTASGACKYGQGNISVDIDVIYKNGTKVQPTICYDRTDGALSFNHTIKEYITIPTYRTEEYYEEIIPIRNNNYEGMPVYDLGVQKAKVTIDWKDSFKFGQKVNHKFWTIGYDTDLDTEVLDGIATVLDPFFNSSWTRRMTINLTCPSSAVGDQRCFFNDSVIVQFDHNNLVTAGLSRVDGFDVRVVFRNDSIIDLDQNEIALFNLTGWNQTNTSIQFRLQGGSLRTNVVLTAGVLNTSYYLMFGNTQATSQGYTISEVFDRGGMDHNQTNLLVCYDFDNETGEANDPTSGMGKVVNRCKSEILGVEDGKFARASGALAIDLEPNVDVIGNFGNVSGMSALGRSVSFNAQSARCLVSQDEAEFNFANFTTTSWFKTNTSAGGTNSGAIVSFGSTPTISMDIGANNGLFRCYVNDAGVETIATTTLLPESGIWHFGACVYHTNGTLSVYWGNRTHGLRKVLSADSTANTIDDYVSNLTIGNREPCTGATNVFTGSIDDVFIYNASLEQNEIAALYNRTRPREGGEITYQYGAQEIGVPNTAPVIFLNTSIWPNGTSIHLNETSDVKINVTYTDAEGDNGTINGTFIVNNSVASFIAIGINVRDNQTITFNLSNTTFGRNATIYFNATGSDNQSTAATMVSTRNVTVANIPPPQVTNLTPTNAQRVRQNWTTNWNQTGDADDPLSNLGWNTTVNGTAFCGRKNATTSCLILSRPSGQNSFNITTLDGENFTSNSLIEVIVDETIPSIDNVTNHSIFVTNVTFNWTTNEPTNYSLNYSQDCTNLNNFVRGTSFNQSVSVALTGLASGKFYCYQVTVYDNVTSEFGSNYNTSAIRNFTLNALPRIVLNTSIWPNGTNTHLNESVDVAINVTYLDIDGDNGTINGTFIINGSTLSFVNIGVAVRPNQTIQFNLSNTTFGRNATIYFNATGSHNISNDLANTSTSSNVTVTNIPPPAISNLTPTASQRVRQNFTINWNQTGDEDDPLSNLGWNTTVNGTAFCGRKNSTTSCLVLGRPAGQSSFNITTLDGENYTSNALIEVIVDEIAPSYVNLSNVSVQNTQFTVNWTIDEPSNFTINYSDNCANLNQRISGTSFNTSGSVIVGSLIDGTQYCWRITFNDNVTSEFGANINTSPTFNLTTSGSPPSGQPSVGGGAGGGGGPSSPTASTDEISFDEPVNLSSIVLGTSLFSAGPKSGGGITIIQLQGSNKTDCDIDFSPKTVKISDGRKFSSVLISNNEEISYSPRVGILNVTGINSALPRLVISNPLGEVLPHRQGQVGLIIDQGIEGGDPVQAENQLLLIDDRCKSVLVTIETDVTGKTPLLSFPLFDSIVEFLSSIPQKIMDLISFFGEQLSKPVTESFPILKVYMLFLVILALSIGIIFSLDISKITFIDTGFKVTGVVLGAPILTAIAVTTLRTMFGG